MQVVGNGATWGNLNLGQTFTKTKFKNFDF